MIKSLFKNYYQVAIIRLISTAKYLLFVKIVTTIFPHTRYFSHEIISDSLLETVSKQAPKDGKIQKQTINQDIKASRVFLISEKGQAWGEVSRDQALALAYEKGLDLVAINDKAIPPVCKIIDLGKYLYEKTKQVQKQKSKHRTPELKEIKLSLRIDKHDLEVKVNRAKEFLDHKNKVRIFLQLKGRERIFSNKAVELIGGFKEKLGAEYDQVIKRAGSNISAILKK